MNSGSHPRVTGRGLLWANARRVHYDEAGRSLDEIARDYNGSGDDYRGLLAHTVGTASSATPRGGCEHRLHAIPRTQDVIGGVGGDLDSYVDLVQALDQQGRIVSSASTPEPAGDWESSAPPVADPEEVLQPDDSPITGVTP